MVDGRGSFPLGGDNIKLSIPPPMGDNVLRGDKPETSPLTVIASVGPDGLTKGETSPEVGFDVNGSLPVFELPGLNDDDDDNIVELVGSFTVVDPEVGTTGGAGMGAAVLIYSFNFPNLKAFKTSS